MSTDKVVPIRAGAATPGTSEGPPRKSRQRSAHKAIIRQIEEINGTDIGSLCDELRCLAALVSDTSGLEEVRLCDVGSLIGGLARRLQAAKNEIEALAWPDR